MAFPRKGVTHAFAETRENRIIKIETADKVLIIVKVCLKQLQLIVTMAIN